MKWLIALLVLGACRTIAPEAQSIDALLTERASRGFSGVVLVEKNGASLFEKAYGLANRGHTVANTIDTRFHVASVAKMFTAAAIMKLEEQGKLSTSDLISKYLGPFDDGETGVTIHHLLTHTSGLVVKGTELDESSPEAFVRSVAKAPRSGKPGAAFVYLNAGYTLLAAIIERVSGEPFDTYLERNLFVPAGMTSTTFVWKVAPGDPRVATGYRGETVATLQAAPLGRDDWGQHGPGGVVTTASDLRRWIHALRDGRVLSAASRTKMFTAHFGDEGYGWHVAKTSRGTRVLHRGGGQPEVASEVRWYPDEDAIIVVLRNEHLDSPTPIADAIEKIAFH
jgi:CubicO group peptidase (beta-lactamase class C family)